MVRLRDGLLILAVLLLVGSGLRVPVPGLAGGAANCQTFPQTGQTACGRFLTYWQTHGGLARLGAPIAPERTAVGARGGRPYTVQPFERAVLELHPENAPPTDVLQAPAGPDPVREQPAGLEDKVPLRAGVTIRLTREESAGADSGLESTGRETVCAATNMYWVFAVENESGADYTADVDRSSLVETDSTGRTYPLGDTCGQGAWAGAFDARPSGTTHPGRTTAGSVAVNADGIPAAATYLDLEMTVSGVPLHFRYTLP